MLSFAGFIKKNILKITFIGIDRIIESLSLGLF